MKIPVERLEETPQPFAFEGDTRWWRQSARRDGGLPTDLSEPLELRLEAWRIGGEVFLQGAVGGGIELECGRCLARYRQTLDEPFRLALEPAGHRRPADPEGAEALVRNGLCLGEEIETGWYREPEIDLGDLAREVVTLALPVQPLCGQDCAGLCSQCGADLNQTSCDCREVQTESPFAALEVLRDGRRQGET